MFFFIFLTQNTNADGILFYDFVNVSDFYWKFYVFKIKVLANSLAAFVILAGLRSAGFEYLTILHLEHLLSLIY